MIIVSKDPDELSKSGELRGGELNRPAVISSRFDRNFVVFCMQGKQYHQKMLCKQLVVYKHYNGVERFSRLYFSPGFIPQMRSMHSDVSLSVWHIVTS